MTLFVYNEEIEQYKKIINILSRLNNEHLIKYYDTFMENDSFNILMEYVGDNNLKQFIQNHKNNYELIEQSIIRDILIQICQGLKEIHDNKMIHRDLTPDNIFIDKNNKIKIGDFGISKILTSLNNYANTQIGKRQYLAPEVLRGLKYNNKVDIYSLGCILYELFTLNEYYEDKFDEKECKINTDIYKSKYQELIELLLKQDYKERPNIDEVLNYIYLIEENYIIGEINIEEKDINKEINIIKLYEKEIKNNCIIKINDNNIDLNYFYKFKKSGKYIIKYIFTNNITKTNNMFDDCKSLIKINLSNFNALNVKDMSNMFSRCESLTNINLSNFNTQNVINMSYMFYGCKSLTNLNLSNFDTQNVTDMSNMFSYCESLTNLNLSNFNTQNVTDMNNMFSECKSLIQINLSNFNTQNVKNMSRMFDNCISLTNLNLSNFNAQNVADMSYMFCGCELLKNINLSNFNTQNVIKMNGMFSGCNFLKKKNIITKDIKILNLFN